jgi:hypothetical protein
MDRIPAQSDLTLRELLTLREVAGGFRSGSVPAAQKARLVQLGLIHEVLGGLMITPAGIMVARR